MIVVTGATGQLGNLVVRTLLGSMEAGEIVAAARTSSHAGDLAELGVQVREADYDRPETLKTAFAGATKVLLISGTDPGKRVNQHKAVIDAAKAAGAYFLAYTSLLHCATSPLLLAKDHLATEEYLTSSGLNYSLLRNGWYLENQTAAAPQAAQSGSLIGASGQGRFAAASRADYAEAAAAVLTGEVYKDSTLELGGDHPYTRAELAAEISRQSGKTVIYHNLTETQYRDALSGLVPPEFAGVLADVEVHAAQGALDDESHTLSRILGRPTTSLSVAVELALGATRPSAS